MSRLLVVSHPAVLAVNQLPYVELLHRGWDPYLIVPSSWQHDYSDRAFAPEVHPDLSDRVLPRRVILKGRVQRHGYVTSMRRLIGSIRPQVAFVEQEPTSVAGFQWGRALSRAGVPFGLQVAENLHRPWPLPARVFQRWSLAHASFVAARSPTAAAVARDVRPDVVARVIPHHVPQWDRPLASGQRDRRFVVGFAGRLVAEKGLDVLIDAVAGVDGVAVRLVGNGPMRDELVSRAERNGVDLEIDSTVTHDQMAAAYARFDVLVLPSLTTETWVEQFGRVLVEALWCGVPLIGSSSGEIPWVIESTGGGVVVPEGDRAAWREAIVRFRDAPNLRSELAERGRTNAQARFSVQAVGGELDLALREAAGVQPEGRRGPAAVQLAGDAVRSSS